MLLLVPRSLRTLPSRADYDDMSAASADDRIGERERGEEKRLSNVKKPCFVLHARDDPIIHADSLPLGQQGSGAPSNVLLLMTKHGGHIGWPTGWLPFLTRFGYSTGLALTFIDGLHRELASSPSQRERASRERAWRLYLPQSTR